MGPLTVGSDASPMKPCCAKRAQAAAAAAEAARGAGPRGPASGAPTDTMIRIAPGRFAMGSDRHYREERPVRPMSVDGFWIDPTPVTNAEFARFVDATGYRTISERQPDPALYPDADPALLRPGSPVFMRPAARVGLRDVRNWWAYVPGADWRHPYGPDSAIDALLDHPVVHVAYADALAYAEWAGKSLPTEAEWEYAARGGLDGAQFPWGDEWMPGGEPMANTWQGEFPWQNTLEDGFERTSPVRTYPPNGYGLYDVVGNVWEWTRTRWGERPGEADAKSCCAPADPADPGIRHVVKGGSHLCAPNYCLRYRPAARQGQSLDTATSHIGFRCVVRA